LFSGSVPYGLDGKPIPNLAGGPTTLPWAKMWSPDEIAAGRRDEEERRRAYYESLDRKREGLLQKVWRWIKRLLG